MWDLSLLGVVPGMRVAAPRDATRLRTALREAVGHSGPTAVRFPKGAAGVELPSIGRLGRADVLARSGRGGTLVVAAGACARAAVAAAGELVRAGEDVTVVDPRWLLPVDPALVDAADGFRLVVTAEDNGRAGGYGDALARALRSNGSSVQTCTLGLRQEFIPHGGREDILALQGLNAEGITRAVRSRTHPLRVAVPGASGPFAR
jgi:1-deoxy-D-xylulose-5-phosphate synthase